MLCSSTSMTKRFCLTAGLALFAHTAIAADRNPLIGQWELNGEDGFVRGRGKIHCDQVGLKFDATSMSVGTGPLASPAFGPPSRVAYGYFGSTVAVAIPGGNRVDYVFTSEDEMGIDSFAGCKYRRVGSKAPTLAEHEAMQARTAGLPVEPRGDDPLPQEAGVAPLPKVLDYDQSLQAIDKATQQ